MVLNQNRKIAKLIYNHDFKSNDFKYRSQHCVYSMSFRLRYPTCINTAWKKFRECAILSCMYTLLVLWQSRSLWLGMNFVVISVIELQWFDSRSGSGNVKIRDNTSHDHRPPVRDTRLIEDFTLLEDEDEHPAATKPGYVAVGYCRVWVFVVVGFCRSGDPVRKDPGQVFHTSVISQPHNAIVLFYYLFIYLKCKGPYGH